MSKSVLFSDITIVTPHDDAPVSVCEHVYCAVAGNTIVYVGDSKEDAEAALSGMGAFLGFTSEKVFEESFSGILAGV